MVEHAGQRAASDPAQCWPRNGRGGRGRRAGRPGEGDGGGAGAPVHRILAAPAGAAGVYPQGERQAAPARHRSDHGPRPPGTGKNALEPEWEARFEPRSYGFRPGRSCQDAAGALYGVLRGKARRVWILDADLTAAFDKIGHSFLLEQLGSFPARDMIGKWLTAGVFEAGKGFAPTEEGTPQGGIISPCLLNVALHGLEEAAGVRYRTSGTHAGEAMPGSPVAVRYADDMVVLCHSQEQAGHVKARLAEWLAPRGLAFNEDKTHIVHLSTGMDFLRSNIRRYPNRQLLIKPSEAAIRRLRERLAAETRTLRGGNAMAVIAALNPIIRGWAA